MKFTRLQARSEYKLASYTGPHSDGVCVCLVVGFGNNSFELNSHQMGLLSMSIPALKRPAEHPRDVCAHGSERLGRVQHGPLEKEASSDTARPRLPRRARRKGLH